MKSTASGFILMLALLLSSCDGTGGGKLPIPPPDLLENNDRLNAGQQLFALHCAECHGSLAEGRTQRAARFNPQAPDFHEKRYRKALPGYLYRRILNGRRMEPFRSRGSVMPAWKPHLTEEQIWSLVSFILYRAGAVQPE